MKLPLPAVVFRGACLLTAIGNMAGNLAVIFLYKPLFGWLHVPMPADRYTFTTTCALSFTMGVAAFFVFLRPDRNADMLKVGIAGKGLFAAATYYFYATHGLHWFWLALGAYDALFVGVFFLYLMTLVSPDLPELQRGDLHASLPREPSKLALIVTFSLTGNGSKAVRALQRGLERGGYRSEVVKVDPQESLFRFPMSFFAFVRIIVRAAFRVRAHIAPLDVPRDRDYDLVVIEGQTWLLGPAAPAEAALQDPANAWMWKGRDAAALVVCRGAWRRSQAMLVRWLERRGANVVASRGFTHKGREPLRLFMLWFYLIFRGRGWVQSLYGLSEETLQEIEHFGHDLASRHRPGEESTDSGVVRLLGWRASGSRPLRATSAVAFSSSSVAPRARVVVTDKGVEREVEL